MRTSQLRWHQDSTWTVLESTLRPDDRPALILVFASPDLIHDGAALAALRQQYPDAILVGGSTAGNVLAVTSSQSDMVATVVAFDHSRVRLTSAQIDASSDIGKIAEEAVAALVEPDLRHVLVLSDGLSVNGSELAKGLNARLDIPVTGGLMGDNGAFVETFVIADGPPLSNRIAFIGLYGERLTVRHGCFAGWEEFGINRVITRSNGNIVHEIDGQPALALYKKYLGDFASGLPASGLRFPLSIRNNDGRMLIRTLLGINEADQSLQFAGDVPEGATTLLMKGNTDNLIDGASRAANQARQRGDAEGLAVIISCVGRRMVMDQMVDEELDVISEVLGPRIRLTGFYSYGELAPLDDGHAQCSLHNQTMTLITMTEA